MMNTLHPNVLIAYIHQYVSGEYSHCSSYSHKSNAQVIDKELVKKYMENLNRGLLAILCEVYCSVHANYFVWLTTEIFWEYFRA